MSEPLSTNDIEDVVSSVRRLVSPEARPRPVSRDLAADRLILTSSLRIVAEQQTSGPPLIKLEAVARKPRTAARSAKAAAGQGAPSKDATGDFLVPEAGRRISRVFWNGPAESLSEVALGAEEAEVVAGDALETAAPATPKRRRISASAASTRAKSTKSATKSTGAKAKGTSAASGKRAAKTLASVPPATDMATKPAESVAASENGFAEPMADYVPKMPVEAEEITTAAVPTLTDRNGNPISLLDEDDLIQLLRQVIREELQGDLGEKITRNVRKLVRAEINRALTAQTLD